MKLICGLGNPGAKYQNTRHNVGFMICEILSKRHGISITTRKFSGLLGSGRIGNEKTLILLPQTYMNRSGNSLGPALHFYKLETSDLIVIHDDIDLDPGRISIKVGGGTAGHKGLNSLRSNLGNGDFIRVRFGVGRPEIPLMDVSDFVLSKFGKTELKVIEERLLLGADAVESILNDGPARAANIYNGRDFEPCKE